MHAEKFWADLYVKLRWNCEEECVKNVTDQTLQRVEPEAVLRRTHLAIDRAINGFVTNDDEAIIINDQGSGIYNSCKGKNSTIAEKNNYASDDNINYKSDSKERGLEVCKVCKAERVLQLLLNSPMKL